MKSKSNPAGKLQEEIADQQRNELAADCLKPSLALLSKLGSIAVHAEEYFESIKTNPHAAHFDLQALQTCAEDPEVKAWLAGMQRLALLPVKRDSR